MEWRAAAFRMAVRGGEWEVVSILEKDTETPTQMIRTDLPKPRSGDTWMWCLPTAAAVKSEPRRTSRPHAKTRHQVARGSIHEERAGGSLVMPPLGTREQWKYPNQRWKRHREKHL